MQSERPYVGARPFTRAEAPLFYARERAAELLTSLTIIHPLVLLYGPTGAGKTSLINAALIPRLEEMGFAVLPPVRVSIHPATEQKRVQNPFVFNALTHCDDRQTEPGLLTQMSFSDYLREKRNNQDSGSIGADSRVLIFDQFEELFTKPELWREREPFFIQIRDAMELDRDLRIIFVMREDYVGELDSYASILPDRIRSRFRLELLRRPEALRAISNPLRDTKCRFAPGVAEKIIDDLLQIHVNSGGEIRTMEGEFVEPVQLQVVAQNLWDSLDSDETLITEEHLSSIGDVQYALRGMYERAVERASRTLRLEEGTLRRRLQDLLITPEGTRAQILRGTKSIVGLPEEAIDILESEYVLRAQHQRGTVWYELTNDRLVQPILLSNKEWFATHEVDIQRRIESRAGQWVNSGKSSAALLNGEELLEAENWLQSFEASNTAYDANLLSFIEASRALLGVETRRSDSIPELRQLIDEQTLFIRKLLITVVTLIVLLILSIGFIVFTLMR